MELNCSNCRASNWGTFVHYGSFIYKCLSCGQDGPLTSFVAIAPRLSEVYEAIIVDEELKKEKVLAKGRGSALAKIVEETANTGKLVWLKPIE